MEDLFKALQMFKTGVQDFQMQRSISQANEQVQQIRASDAAETKKRAELQAVANNLVPLLAQSGTPDTTIESVKNAFTNNAGQFKTGMDIYRNAALTGNHELMSIGLDVQQQEEDLKLKQLEVMREIKMQQAAEAKAKEQSHQDEQGSKDFVKFSDSINPEKQVRSAMGRAAITKQQGEKIMALAGGDISPQGLAKLTNENLTEMAITTASMLKSGVPTGEEVKRFLKPTAVETASNIKQYLTANPQPAQRAALAKMLIDTAARETSVSQLQSNEHVINQLNKAKSMVRSHPALEADIQAEVANRIGISPEDVILNVNSKAPATTRQNQEIKQKMDEAIKVFNRARMEVKSKDPTVRAQALNFFKATGMDPSHSLENNKILLKHFLSSRSQ